MTSRNKRTWKIGIHYKRVLPTSKCEYCDNYEYERTDSPIRYSNPLNVEVECVYCGNVQFKSLREWFL
jgi:hypothetical protein